MEKTIVVDEITPDVVYGSELNQATGVLKIRTDKGTLVLRQPEGVINAAAKLLAQRRKGRRAKS